MSIATQHTKMYIYIVKCAHTFRWQPGVARTKYNNILGYVEHTRGEPSLHASVYIIISHVIQVARCTNVDNLKLLIW